MNTLFRYLLRQNLFLLLVLLATGTAIFYLVDLFDRLDDFLEADLGFAAILHYLAVKTPFILSQILPAVFLIAAVVQLTLMGRGRELLALRSSGISLRALLPFFLIYGLLASCAQFGLSQFFGAEGLAASRQIWNLEVKKRNLKEERKLRDVWFREGERLVRIGLLRPLAGTGERLTVYELEGGEEKGRRDVARIIKAERFQAPKSTSAQGDPWVLEDVRVLSPRTFSQDQFATYQLELSRTMAPYIAADPHEDPSRLPIWELGRVIRELSRTGSNVERLQTVWHMKLAYATSLLVMALLALAVACFFAGGMGRIVSISRGVGASLLIVFVYYGVFVTLGSAGEQGLVSPVVAAWTANVVFGLAALFTALYLTRSKAG